MRRALILLVALSLPSLAGAQTAAAGQVFNGTSGGDDRFINLAECAGVGDSGPIELLWNVRLASGTATNGVYRIYATNSLGAPGTTEPRYCEKLDRSTTNGEIYAGQVGSDVPAAVGRTTGSAEFATQDIADAATAGAAATCSETLADETITLCVHFHPNDTSGTPVADPTGWAVGSVVLSLRRPPPPTSVTAVGGEGSLEVGWTAGTPSGTQATVAEHRVIVTPQGGAPGSEVTRDAAGTSTRFTGLVNGQAYDVEVFGLSAARNPSATSVATSGTPTETDDFWEFYGGVEQGGCSGGAGGPLALLGLAGLLAVLRRRGASRTLVAVLALAVAAPAAAESPRWGSLELGAQTYRPDIDSEFATSPGPYETIFGGGRGFMFQLGFSRALYTEVGSLEVGLRSGWFRDSGKGILSGSSPPTPSGDDTTFNIVPTSVAVTYRFDWLVERFNVPLAPYGRAALERYNWWVTDGSGSWVEEGATNGWSLTGGVGLLLDFFDPQLARELDMDSGVNHTYLFFEVTRSSVDDFGSSSSWNLSDEKLSLGFGLLFAF